MNTPITVRPARLADAAPLAAFGRRAFTETFAHSTTPADLAAYLDATYGPAQQAAEIADPDVRVVVAELAGDPALGGYALVRRGRTPECVAGPAPVELGRLYARTDLVGRGVGHALLERAFVEATALGGATIWLGVWEHNARAIAFYERHGFRDVGAHGFLLGSDAQTDRLMARPL